MYVCQYIKTFVFLEVSRRGYIHIYMYVYMHADICMYTVRIIIAINTVCTHNHTALLLDL